MIKNVFQTFINAHRPLPTTYRLSLLHSKSHRILKNHFTDLLEKHDLSTLDWAILGILHDHKDGLRFAHIADELGVEAPFVTTLINKLEKKNLIIQEKDSADKRAKVLKISTEGNFLIPRIEGLLKEKFKKLFNNISQKDLTIYLQVLEMIIKND